MIKTRSNPKQSLFAGLLVLLLLLCAGLYAETINQKIIAGDYLLEKGNALEFEIKMLTPGYTLIHSPGDPMLPQKIIQIQVPQNADLSGMKLSVINKEVINLSDVYDILPQLPDYLNGKKNWGTEKSIVDGKNMYVYGKNAFYPADAFELLPSLNIKELDGQSAMDPESKPQFKNVKYIRIAFKPFAYNPVQRKLMFVKSADISITYSSGISRAIAGLQSSSAYANRALPVMGDAADYVIITSNNTVNNSTRLADFVRLKQNEGFGVRIVTETDFGSLTGQAPNGTAEKIRQWLINNRTTLGIDYVLLIGDPDPDCALSATDSVGDIPMKMCYPNYYGESSREAPTDYFYAELDGNWNLDGDLYFGVCADINHAQSPDAAIGPDTFSARWTGKIDCAFTDNYQFSTFSDDAARVYIDGNLVINDWTNHLPTYTSSASVSLTAGKHNITVEYRENTGQAVIKLFWEIVNSATNQLDRQIIPKDRLFHYDTGTSTYIAGGLDVTYYDNINFTGTTVSRVDEVIDTFWGTGDVGINGLQHGADVFVGRIPVYNNNYAELDTILGKIIGYETGTNINWRSSILLPMEPSDNNTPGYSLGEGIRTDLSLPGGYTTHRIYDEDYTPKGGPRPETWPCNIPNVLNEWLNGYGMVTWWTHGGPTGANDVMDSATTSSLNNATPAFVFQASCSNGYPEDINNLGYALLRNGAVATVSASRVSFYGGGTVPVNNPTSGLNECLAYAYTKRILNRSTPMSAGIALYLTKGDIPNQGINELIYNLYGDPACFLLRVTPNYPPVANTFGPYAGSTGSTITLNAGNSYDPEGDALQYRWDKNNDGVWDTSWSSSSTTTITSSTGKVQVVVVQVKDSLGLTGQTTTSVTFVKTTESRFQNQSSGKMLTVVSPSTTPIAVCQPRDTSWLSQEWTIEDGPNGSKRIRSAWTGYLLNVKDSSDYSGIELQPLHTDWGSMQWMMEDGPGGTKRFRNVWSGRYLTVTGNGDYATVVAQPLNTSWGSQQWVLDGTRIRNYWSAKDLTTTGNAADTTVKAQPLDTSWNSQKWLPEIVPGTTYIRLKNVWADNYLTVTDSTNGAGVVCQALNTSWTSQQWSIEYNSGTIKLINVWSGYYLTARDNSDYSDVICTSWSGSLNQNWFIQ